MTAALAAAEATVAAEGPWTAERLQGAQWAGPSLLKAAQLALPAMRSQLRALLEVGCDEFVDGEPERDALDPALEGEVCALEAAIAAVEAAIEEAENPKDIGGEPRG